MPVAEERKLWDLASDYEMSAASQPDIGGKRGSRRAGQEDSGKLHEGRMRILREEL